MRDTTDPQKLAEGKNWLKRLREAECSSFRVYADYIREAAHVGLYTYSELGATEVEVLELAIGHAGMEAKSGYPHHIARLCELQCQLQKLKGAHRPPAYATLVVVNTKQEEGLQKAA
jgi:hypothetical protein